MIGYRKKKGQERKEPGKGKNTTGEWKILLYDMTTADNSNSKRTEA